MCSYRPAHPSVRQRVERHDQANPLHLHHATRPNIKIQRHGYELAFELAEHTAAHEEAAEEEEAVHAKLRVEQELPLHARTQGRFNEQGEVDTLNDGGWDSLLQLLHLCETESNSQ